MSEDKADLQPTSYPIEEAAAATGLTRTHIFRAIRDKKLKARKAGRRTIIERDELANYVKSLPVIGAA
jgi:excisionase family DNA binding protein